MPCSIWKRTGRSAGANAHAARAGCPIPVACWCTDPVTFLNKVDTPPEAAVQVEPWALAVWPLPLVPEARASAGFQALAAGEAFQALAQALAFRAVWLVPESRRVRGLLAP